MVTITTFCDSETLHVLPGTKGCPDCGKKPTVSVMAGGQIEIACLAHGEHRVCAMGETLSEATEAWNNGEDWLKLGAVFGSVKARPTY